jgi:MerR family transcriptional regulator, light-induced transcriptional regulator
VDQFNLPRNGNQAPEGKEGQTWHRKPRFNTEISKKTDSPTSHEFTNLLNKTIEAQIIPRLLMQHGQNRPEIDTKKVGVAISSDEVKHFAELLIHSSNDICLGYIQALRLEGRGLNEIYLDLIAPAARRLGCYWELDEQSFTTVTLALGRVQRIMQELSPDFRNNESEYKTLSGKALLFAMPHSQHTMGVLMLSEFFIQAGWDVTTVANPSREEILTLCREQAFDIVGISISYELQWDAMQELVKAIRQSSANSQIGIMAGGALFNAKPDLMDQCAADICTLSAPDAVIAAENILKSRV